MSRPTSRRRLDAVIFDLGNTLIYFDTDWPKVLTQADGILFAHLKAAGLDLDGREFLPTFRTRLEAYYRERETEFIEYTTQYVLRILLAEWGYPDVPDAILRPALDAMYAATQAHWQPEPDAIPTLQTLKGLGYHIGLISNAADDRDVQTLIDKAGVRPYLERVLTSAAEGIRKPNPRIFHTLLNDWGIPPQRAAMVGDTLGADILGARNAGMFSIWIARRADNPANRAHAGTIRPDATIATLVELPGLLERL
ncbi:MAG TPA: HAD family hydrolase [Anaerolineales bacterium]